MEDVADRIARGETDSREQVGKDLARRKISNTKTSIVLGSDVMTYRTDAMDTQLNILMEGGGAIQIDGKSLKAALQKSTLDLSGDKPDDPLSVWDTNMTSMLGNVSERYGNSNIKKYQGVLDPTLAVTLRTSSVSLGSDPSSFGTANQDAMQYNGADIDYKKIHLDNAVAKKKLSQHNFDLSHGPEKETAYPKLSSSNESYQFDPSKIERSVLSKEVMDDLRREHFKLGYMEADYSTDARSAAANYASAAKERMEGMERARVLKKQLLKTSVVIGDDDVYK
jgi:hypothetical protein